MVKSKKIKLFLILLLVIAIFTKIDFRLKQELECCNDDHDYFIHAETTILDFDFDYSNQLEGFEKRRNYINLKSSPIGFYGSGLLSSPFLLMGHVIDTISENDSQLSYSNTVMFYSFSSIFYLIFTYLIFVKIKKLLEIKISENKLLLIFLGTGLPYYAFERYSMTHVYDTFVLTSLIYFYFFFISLAKKKYMYWVVFLNLLVLVVRWTNYQIFFLPIIIKRLFFPFSQYRMSKFKEFYISTVMSIGIFLIHTKAIWGIYTINPRRLYNDHEFISTYFDSMISTPVQFIINNFIDSFNVLFTQEFGVFWFSPIIFIGVVYLIINLKKDFLLWINVFIVFAYYFSLVNAWQSTANAYGFRYLYPLISISILLFFSLKKNNFKFVNFIEKYLIIFSFLSLISVLFFEGWAGSQLSLVPIENSFGKIEKFVQPSYLTGLIEGFLLFETYLKILTTSFLSLLGFRFILYFYDVEVLNIMLSNFGLPVENSDFQTFLIKVDQINLLSTSLIILLLFIATYLIYKPLLKD